MTRYYVTSTGEYIVGFDGADPPPNSIEVQTWIRLLSTPASNGQSWGPPTPDPSEIRQSRITELRLLPFWQLDKEQL